MGTFLHVLSEQYRTEHFFGEERSVPTEHLDPMFPRTLVLLFVVIIILSFENMITTIRNQPIVLTL